MADKENMRNKRQKQKEKRRVKNNIFQYTPNQWNIDSVFSRALMGY